METQEQQETKEGNGGTTTFVVKCKCMSCSLHFTVYSWKREWAPNHCPECGQKVFMIWREQTQDFIFNFVPGSTPLVGMGVHGGQMEPE